MSALLFLAISVAGGVGAALRLAVDGILRARIRIAYPLGTTVINVTGSLVLGFLVGLALTGVLSAEWRLVLGTGLMGGYTTFSTASVETVRLLQSRRFAAAFGTGLGMLVVSVLAASLGLWAGSRF
ncbi:fluoride efflux transporter CrcB [Lacisediminihabitans sp.]|uniref:fluoride efflux transporter CrcB n=1 Tax=Lacisediminihabitans sp. TaxID=2787631 RepID=UPI002F950DEE